MKGNGACLFRSLGFTEVTMNGLSDPSENCVYVALAREPSCAPFLQRAFTSPFSLSDKRPSVFFRLEYAISRSRWTSLRAADCTLPAKGGLILCHRSRAQAVADQPVNTRLTCCAFTASGSRLWLGESLSNGFFRRSHLKVARLASTRSMPRMEQRCHEMASPSIGSVAR